MTQGSDTKSTAGKRRDVGYGRPPVEHQFKPGQKPPPRKAKAKKEPFKSPLAALWKVLQEQRRIVVNGKAIWLSNAELILRTGFELAEKDDNATISRLVADLMLVGEDPQQLESAHQTVFDEDAVAGSMTYVVRKGPGNQGPLTYSELKQLLADQLN